MWLVLLCAGLQVAIQSSGRQIQEAAGIEALFGWSQFTRMAIHTSLGFLVFGIGASLVAWDVEPRRDTHRSFALIAPAVVASLTVMAGLWPSISRVLL